MLRFRGISFCHPGELEAALKAAAAAYKVHTAETGTTNEEWAGWYADYIFGVDETTAYPIGTFSPWPRNGGYAVAKPCA